MGTRAKLAAFSLGTLAIALLLLVLVAVPTPQPPGIVERIDLHAPRGDEQRADGRTHEPTEGRQRHRSRRGDRRPAVTAHRPQRRSGAPSSGSISTGEADGQPQRTPPDRAAAEAPTLRPRSESGPRAGGPPTPRGTPPSGRQPARSESPAEDDPPDPPERPDPPDPLDEAATAAAVDTPDEPERFDGDPEEEPEPADGEPLM